MDDLNKSIEVFKKERSTFELFTSKLKDLIVLLIDKVDFNYHIIEARTKSLDSYVDKLKEKGDKYINPLA